MAVIFSVAAALLLLSIGEAKAKAVGSGADGGSHVDAIVRLLAYPGSIFSDADASR